MKSRGNLVTLHAITLFTMCILSQTTHFEVRQSCDKLDSYCCIFAKGRHFALPAKVLISLYLLQTTHFKVGSL